MGGAAEELRIYKPSKRARSIASGSLEIGREKAEHVVLYSHYASICSQRARLTLVEKEIPFTSVMLHYDQLETITPTYLGINPRGLVPTIVADGEIVFDSATIMPYLDIRYEGPDLMLGDNAQKKLIRDEIETADFFPIRDHVFRSTMARAVHGSTHSGWGKESVEPFINAMKAFKQKYPQFSNNYGLKISDSLGQFERSADEEVMSKTLAYTERMMDIFEARLSVNNYLAGDEFTLADITWIPIFIRLHYSLEYKLWGDGLRPQLERYFLERIKTRQSFKSAILDHYYNNAVPDGLA